MSKRGRRGAPPSSVRIARLLVLSLLLSGCGSRANPRTEAHATFLEPKPQGGVDTVHVGNYHAENGGMLASIDGALVVRAEIDPVVFYRWWNVAQPPFKVESFASYAGILGDSALPLVLHNIPDTIGTAIGSVTYQLSHDTLSVTYRIGVTGGPWPATVQSIGPMPLVYDSLYAGVTP